MKWSDLSMTERANIIALGVQSGIINLNDIRKGYNSFARGGYTKWKEKIKEHKGIDIDNDPTYDYEGFYNSDPDRAWDMLNKDSNAHFTDKYKTVYHPSFSDESIYSGYRNQFNPNGITGGTWIDDNNYIMSQSQFDNDWDTDATLDYFNSAEDSPVNLYAPDGATVLKGITVTPNKFGGGGGKKNYRIARLNSSGKPVIDYSIPAFSSEQEIDSYMKNNNLEQIFVENLPELVVKHPDLIAKEPAQEANWTDKDKERYARMMESTGWKADTDFADKAIAAEQRARNVSQGAVLGQLASGLNVLSPSQQFGAIVDWAQGEKGYWEGIGGGNSGFFTDEYANEHPIITSAGNALADIATTAGIERGISGVQPQNIDYKIPNFSKTLNRGKELLWKVTPSPIRDKIAINRMLKHFNGKSRGQVESLLNKEAQQFYDENILPKIKNTNPLLIDDPELFTDTNKPVKLGSYPDLGVSGYHTSRGDNAITEIKDKVDAISTAIHELASHGSDMNIPQKVKDFYEDTILFCSDYLNFKNSDSKLWSELRATKNEIEGMLKKAGIDIDDVTDDELIEMLRDTNDYGWDYANDIINSIGNPSSSTNPWKSASSYQSEYSSPLSKGILVETKGPAIPAQYKGSSNPFLDRLRFAIKYLPAVGAVGAAGGAALNSEEPDTNIHAIGGRLMKK